MAILALDFDGVVCDSLREIVAVATQAYLRLEPDASVVRDLAQRGVDDPRFRAFRRLVPLGNRAEDFGLALAALQNSISITNQEEYDHYRRAFSADWIETYHKVFYRCRRELIEASPERWLVLHRPFTSFLELLDAHASTNTYAIATAKDGASVRRLLEHFGVLDLFRSELIFDKDVGVTKTSHLRALSDQLGCPMAAITFVDDKLNHLQKVRPLGVRPVLATWGYNTPREHRLARERGIPIATLTTAAAELFGR
jgi:phosphoglycolate phosphatase-like HAD superfamily hydrolase